MKQLYNRIAMTIAVLVIHAGIVTGQASIPGSRLIADAHYVPSGPNLLPLDSNVYIYPNTTAIVCSQKLSYQNSPSGFMHTRKFDYTYTASDKMTHMEFRNWNTASNSYINGGQTFFTLNGSGDCIKDSNILWIPANNAYRDNVRNTYVLNSAGQITEKTYEYWDAGANHLLNYYHYVNTYNAQGNPLVLLTQEWDASIHWMDLYRSTYVYDAAGTGIQTLTGEQSTLSTPGVLQPGYQNVFSLNTDGSIASYLSNAWNSGTGSFGPSMRITLSYDAAGNNTLQTAEMWDAPTSAYKPYEQYVKTYNTHNQMTSQTRMMWDGTAYASASGRDNYYYEDTGAPTAVGNTTIAVAKLSLAPIPTTGELHIALNWAEPQAFTAIVTDMNGRLCHRFSAEACKDYVGNINLNALPAGNYVLSVKGAKGGSISRMIVLAH